MTRPRDEDWTRWLTEEELLFAEQPWETGDAVKIFRSLASSRALVAKKHEALQILVDYGRDSANPKPGLGVRNIARKVHVALALTEEEMMGR